MRKLILKLIIIIILIPINVYAEDDENLMQTTQEQFNISGFIKEANKYTNGFLGEIDLNDYLNQAISGNVDNKTLYQKIIKLFGKEITESIKTLVSILVIIVIHGILKSITDNLENNSISQIIYFVQYILIVILIMSNFTGIIGLVKETANDLVSFINLLIPLLLSLLVYTGSIATSTMIQPILLFSINFISNIIQDILIPIVLIVAIFSIISKISEKVQIDKLSKFLKSGVIWSLGVILTLFVGIVSLEGTLSSSVDGITAKTAKAAVSGVIPVVGKILGDVVDSVLGCGVILKNAIGLIGVIVVIGICIVPIIKIAILSIMYNLASAVIQPISDEKIVKLLEEMGRNF